MISKTGKLAVYLVKGEILGWGDYSLKVVAMDAGDAIEGDKAAVDKSKLNLSSVRGVYESRFIHSARSTAERHDIIKDD